MPQSDEINTSLTRAGLNLIQQGLSIFDRDLRLAVCNQRFQSMFDFPDALVTPGAAFEDVIRFQVMRGEYGPVDDPEEAIRVRVDAARAFVPHYMERQRANGRWISVEGSPLPQGGWVTVYTDITEIKLQEGMLRSRSEELSSEVLANAERLAQINRELAATIAALQEAKRELTEMEARTRLTTEMMPAHIAHVGRDLRYTYSNRRLSSVLPGRPQDILGLTGHEALGAQTFARIERNLRQALDGQASVLEFTDDDSGRRIRSAFTPDRIGEGPINGVYILSADVTEEAQARAALLQTRKRELAAQLTSGLAHDFGNLLTIIMGLQSRLAKRTTDEEVRDVAQATLAAARRGGALLQGIGTISGRREPRPQPVDLGMLLEETRTLAQATLPEQHRLTIDAPPLGFAVILDPGALQDALLNLILNARDAMGAAPGTIALSLRLIRDTWAEFALSDDGPGFTPEALKRGMDPFFTTKGGAGTGLGLAMVYDHAQMSGGTVRLGNRPEGGARVTLRLPLRRAALLPEPGLVLLAEDSDPIRESVREMLRAMGHAVIEATSAEEAEALTTLPGLSLVLSDIMLAGSMTGADLAQRLAGRADAPPVVLMTSLPATDPRRAGVAGRFAIVQKPFDAETLGQTIAQTLGEPA
jgi:signal transduction histidine kinase/CheY-like chemotaxis protein